MRISLLSVVAASALAVAGCQSMDGMNSAGANAEVTTVGGAEMYPSRNIVENAMNSPIHTTLVSAVKAADLVDTLSGPGPFTVFAPTNAAFAKVPSATLNSLMEPANKASLQKVLTYHVVPGRITGTELAARILAGGGSTTLTTVEGEKLTFTMSGTRVMVKGMGASSAYVTQADVMQSNGVIHVVDGVLLPSM